MKAAEAKVGTKVLYRDTENDRILKGTISSKLILSQYGLCVRLDLDEPGEGHTVALIEICMQREKNLQMTLRKGEPI